MLYSFIHKPHAEDYHEDSLTSTIIGTLLHLGDKDFWEILYNSCSDNEKLPKTVGALKSYKFWPRWYKENSTNKYKEPDVFLGFTDFNIIIEAKRDDSNPQKQEQWNEQHDEYQYKEKKLYFIALDGNRGNFASEKLVVTSASEKPVDASESPIVFKSSWMDLHKQIHKFSVEKEKSNRDKRIVDTILSCCAKLGIWSHLLVDDKEWIYNYDVKIPAEDDYSILPFKE